MNMETKQKIKEFYIKHKIKIVCFTSMIIGGIIVGTIIKSKPGEIHEFEVLPEWAKEWQQKCQDDMLLYKNGLPIFEDEECTILYRDALAEEFSVEDAEERGYTVIERA